MSISQESMIEVIEEALANHRALEQTNIALLKACIRASQSGDYIRLLNEVRDIATRPTPPANKLLFRESYYKRFARRNIRLRNRRHSLNDPAPMREPTTLEEKLDLINELMLSGNADQEARGEAMLQELQVSNPEHFRAQP